VPRTSLVGAVPLANAGATDVVALTSWKLSAALMAVLVELLIIVPVDAVNAAKPLATIQPMTTSDACVSVPVAGHVNGVVISAVKLAGLASIGGVVKGPSMTPAIPTQSFAEAVAAILTEVNDPATVTRE